MAEHNWANGEALRAVDVNNVLERQVVVTTTSGARGATWLGKHVWLSDWQMMQVWNGSAWKSYPKGILVGGAVTAGGPGTLSSTVLTGTECTVDVVAGETYVFDLQVNASTDTPALCTISIGAQYDGGSGYVGVGPTAAFTPAYAGVSERVSLRHVAQIGASHSGAKFRGVISCSVGQGSWESYTNVSVTHMGTT